MAFGKNTQILILLREEELWSRIRAGLEPSSPRGQAGSSVLVRLCKQAPLLLFGGQCLGRQAREQSEELAIISTTGRMNSYDCD